MFNIAATGPLNGLKVLDLSRLVCGNMLTLNLADFGADVIKVEDPVKGDPLRDWRVNGVPTYWKVYSRNKRSLALDLRAEAGLAVLKRLIETADVFVEGFRPGSIERMGLAPDVLLALNPRLVITRISGFGQTGDYKDRPGFGTLVEAMSGFAAKTGFPDSGPVLPPTALADMIAGIYGAFATMVALQARTPEGGGQVIDLSLLEPMISVLGPDPAIFRMTGKIPERTGNRSQTTAPRNVWRTADGKYVAISASIQSMAARLFMAVGRPDMIEDPRFRTNTDRVRHADLIDEIVGGWIAGRTLDENLAVLQEAGVTAGPVYDVSQLVEDRHIRSREALVDMPDEDAGSILMHNIIPRLSGTPGAFRRPAPRHGADSRDILAEAGFAATEIDRLIAGAVVVHPAAKTGEAA